MDIVRKAKHAGQVVYAIFMIILAMLVIASVVARIMAEQTGSKVNFFGYTPTIVVSGSMLPEIQIDSLNIIKDTDFEDVKVGDIVVYWSSLKNINILHRVVGETELDDGSTAFIVKGDANPVEDSEVVTEDNFQGTVILTINWIAPFLDNIVVNGRVNYVELVKLAALAVLVIWAVASLIYSLFYIGTGELVKYINKKRGISDGIQEERGAESAGRHPKE